MLKMHDQITFRQIGKINFQRRLHGRRVRRLEPSRALDFVAAENFRVGDDDKLCVFADKPARQCADARCDRGVKAGILPDFLEALTLAVVVAENVDRVILPPPAMKLGEEFAALRLSNQWIGCASGERSKCFQRSEGWRSVCLALAQRDPGDAALIELLDELVPSDVEWIIGGNLRGIFVGTGGQ